MLGLSLHTFTVLHTAISLVGIAAGLLFFAVPARGRWLGAANAAFLFFTILTSVTGFMFPPKPIGPPFIFGVISLALFAVALFALYGPNRAGAAAGGWRRIYLLTALIAQWLKMVVLVVQSYQKIPALNALAPTGTELPVLVTQAAVLALVAWLGWRTLRRPTAERIDGADFTSARSTLNRGP